MISLVFQNATFTTFVRFDTNLFLGGKPLADVAADTGRSFTVMDIKDRSDAEVRAGLGFERLTYTLADFVATATSLSGVGLYAVTSDGTEEIVAP